MTDFPSAQPSVALAPPGWYPDPHLPGQMRWFDGTQWTAHVQATPPTAMVPGAQAVVWDALPYAPASQRNHVVEYLIPVNRSALSVAAGYAGLLSILLVFAPIALVLGVLALRDLSSKPTVGGRGRAWFGVVAGALGTLAFIAVLVP